MILREHYTLIGQYQWSKYSLVIVLQDYMQTIKVVVNHIYSKRMHNLFNYTLHCLYINYYILYDTLINIVD